MVEESSQGHAERSQGHQGHRGQVNGGPSDFKKAEDKKDTGYAGSCYNYSKIVEKTQCRSPHGCVVKLPTETGHIVLVRGVASLPTHSFVWIPST